MGKVYNIYGQQGKKMALELLNNLALDLSPEMTVGIKPNLVLAKKSESGATTDPDLVAGVIEYLKSCGIKDIHILEGAWVGDETKRAFKVCGYNELASKYDVELYDLKDDLTQTYVSGELEIEVCQQPFAVDYLINMPVLKAHCQTKMTCALKNLKGCIPDAEKRRFHTLGLHKPIAHLNKILSCDLVIVDGIFGDLTFEEGGNPVQMNRVIGGKDPVLIDTFVARLLGYEADEVCYITLAEELGIGSTDLKEAEIVQLNRSDKLVEAERMPVQSAIDGAKKVAQLTKNIKENEACSACFGSLVHALQRIEEQYGIPKGSMVHIGQGFQDESLTGVGVGKCTKEAKYSISGCPPDAKRIIDKLTEFWELD